MFPRHRTNRVRRTTKPVQVNPRHKRYLPSCAFLDYSSAFNTIPRHLILNKTPASGSPGWVVSWLEDYFTSRTQFVQSGKWKSTVLPNNCGVLQGAILSPHLFSLHTDDLRSPNDCLYIKYAEDMVVDHPLKNQTHLQCLKDGLDHVAAWSSDNGLQLNHEKSVQRVFHLQPSPSSQFSAVLPNEISSLLQLKGVKVPLSQLSEMRSEEFQFRANV
ncbi:unnamed protein product [Schistocephalus solidus]|uniref:Reverse transcriptase domain-containing protein n=1 Tax=Schistocephalus solidus TaxID=70667 RepID=A0A3P7DQJ9_SCHSO|nr:unnamed protein product [Schistocephalus solidus]